MRSFSEKALAAAVDAMADADRIQGFTYGSENVIRDVYRPWDAQVLWRGPASDTPAFERQCDIERLRIGFTAAAKVMADERSGHVIPPFKHGGGCMCAIGNEATCELVACPRVPAPSLSAGENGR